MQHRRTIVTAVVSATAALMLAACGSQLDPSTVRMANGVAAGEVGGDAGLAGDVTGVDPATGGDTGTTGGSGGSAGSTGGTSGSTGSTGGTSGSTGSTGGTSGGGANAATGGTKAGNCDGFKNQTGITDDKIVISNASDISGPVPGLFESAQQATKAYVAYFIARCYF